MKFRKSNLNANEFPRAIKRVVEYDSSENVKTFSNLVYNARN